MHMQGIIRSCLILKSKRITTHNFGNLQQNNQKKTHFQWNWFMKREKICQRNPFFILLFPCFPLPLSRRDISLNHDQAFSPWGCTSRLTVCKKSILIIYFFHRRPHFQRVWWHLKLVQQLHYHKTQKRTCISRTTRHAFMRKGQSQFICTSYNSFRGNYQGKIEFS